MMRLLNHRINKLKRYIPEWGIVILFWVILVLLIASIVRPPGVLVSMPEPEVVHTSNIKVGVHTRLTDEVEPWKIQRSLMMVREMGAPWIVEYFPWPYIEPTPDSYTWTHSDMIISHARNQGLTVIARLGWVPDWARPDPKIQETTFTYLDSAHYDDFTEYVVKFVEHYEDQIRHIIIWNEPNLSFEWGYRQVDPTAYVDLLRVVYPAVHKVNPDIIVLAGALAPTLEPEGSPAGLNDLLYLEAMYQADASPYFDALAVHTYGFKSPVEELPHPDIINYRRVELLRAIMNDYGDTEKDIYITESGWNDHPRWTWAVTPAQRIQYTLDAYNWADNNWPWCPVVAMWMFRTPIALHNYQDYYAFVTPEFQKRPIYGAVQIYTGNQ